MGLMLPGELAHLLNMLGFRWPESDEEQLFALGQEWLGFAGMIEERGALTDALAQEVSTANRSEAVEDRQETGRPPGRHRRAGGHGGASPGFGRWRAPHPTRPHPAGRGPL